jgi:hypothetical protein
MTTNTNDFSSIPIAQLASDIISHLTKDDTDIRVKMAACKVAAEIYSNTIAITAVAATLASTDKK